MNAGRACGSLSNSCTAHEFTQQAIQTVRDMSTSRIKQTKQHSVCTSKTTFPHNFYAVKNSLTFTSHNPLPAHILISIFCLLIRNVFFKILSLVQMFSFQMQHILKYFSYYIRIINETHKKSHCSLAN